MLAFCRHITSQTFYTYVLIHGSLGNSYSLNIFKFYFFVMSWLSMAMSSNVTYNLHIPVHLVTYRIKSIKNTPPWPDLLLILILPQRFISLPILFYLDTICSLMYVFICFLIMYKYYYFGGILFIDCLKMWLSKQSL